MLRTCRDPDTGWTYSDGELIGDSLIQNMGGMVKNPMWEFEDAEV